ncbi:unnamed protein product [Trifolium pratense]|uniref:Uncharacterized protein n=1 Tax=Trifolium pratense TaxID=57577 RepID=A0ACB0KKX5_TRIPR|nr:unnamed protein product [Trifolium pratense]
MKTWSRDMCRDWTEPAGCSYKVNSVDQEAQEAIRYFNKSYLGSLIITCEVVRMLGANLPRLWIRLQQKKGQQSDHPIGFLTYEV